jgi:hypothetical protein
MGTMSLTATVVKITTCTKHLPTQPKIDLVQLSYKGHSFDVETAVGRLKKGQEVAVVATALTRDNFPLGLRLAS